MADALILDGARLAKEIEAELSGRVERLRSRTGRSPKLATILVGADPASATYVRMKRNACKRVGMESVSIELAESTTTEALLKEIEKLNADGDVHGILLQHPVPEQVDERAAFDRISLEKDVDGVTTQGFGRMAMGEPVFGSATPAGIMRLLDHHEISLEGARAVVIGRSPILGKPIAAMLLNRNATVTVCHSRTRDLADVVREGELVVAAVGLPRFIQGDWIRDGAVVVDAGFHPERCGDVDLRAAIPRASAYTPVPGGVGPMTIATLIAQTVEAGEAALELRAAMHPVRPEA